MESSPFNHEHLDSYSQLDGDFHDHWAPRAMFTRPNFIVVAARRS